MIERIKLGTQTPSDEFLTLFLIIGIPIAIVCIFRILYLFKSYYKQINK